MSLFISSLNSGSNGNCYYIGNDKEAVLIDAGISCRETEIRLKRSGLDIQKIRSVFITHEHTDHIKGLCGLVKKHQWKVFITEPTLRHSGLSLARENVSFFLPYIPVTIGNISVTAFPKIHDAADPHSFVISCGNTRVGVFTDIGVLCSQVISHFRDCHAVFLEANYDKEMLLNGNYPYHLKRRISGGKGHLSNAEAIQLFKEYRSPQLSHLLLSHLSGENNCPKLVAESFEPLSGNTKIIVASRFMETDVLRVGPLSEENVPDSVSGRKVPANVPSPSIRKKRSLSDNFQLSLF